MSLFQLSQVSLSYAGAQALKPCDLEIGAGEFVGILGPNGAGKSTLLRILAGLLQPTSGEVRHQGQPFTRMTPRDRARHLALVPQWTLMAFPFRVEEIVLMGRHPHLGRFAFESPRDTGLAEEAMEKTDVARFRSRSFDSLSGGEMQRVILARAMAQAAPTMLLDEPTSALDLHHQARIYGILRELNAAGTTVVVTTHDLNLASLYCKRILLLQEGEILADGSPQEVLTETNIRKIYCTEVEILEKEGRTIILPGGKG